MLKELYENTLKAKYIHTVEETASYYTEREGNTLYIYFEKSNGATDWRNNFTFPAKPYRDMQNKWYAHRGFLKVWKVIEPLIRADIFNLDINRIIISGYSHGGAIALLCYEYCKFNRPDAVIEGYGFGAPRVVWGFLRKPVKERFKGFIVIRNGNDLVTHLPPVFLGFRHIGKVKKIGKSKGVINDHTPYRYRKALAERIEYEKKDGFYDGV